jgi:hypothetical protein
MGFFKMDYMYELWVLVNQRWIYDHTLFINKCKIYLCFYSF